MSESNIIPLDLVTRLDIDADRVLQRAMEKGLKQVVVLGYDADGDEYFCSSIADGGTVLWLLERFKLQLLRIADK